MFWKHATRRKVRVETAWTGDTAWDTCALTWERRVFGLQITMQAWEAVASWNPAFWPTRAHAHAQLLRTRTTMRPSREWKRKCSAAPPAPRGPLTRTVHLLYLTVLHDSSYSGYVHTFQDVCKYSTIIINFPYMHLGISYYVAPTYTNLNSISKVQIKEISTIKVSSI